MKQFTKTELKMMVYKRTKEGMPYDKAYKEVENLIKQTKKHETNK